MSNIKLMLIANTDFEVETQLARVAGLPHSDPHPVVIVEVRLKEIRAVEATEHDPVANVEALRHSLELGEHGQALVLFVFK